MSSLMLNDQNVKKVILNGRTYAGKWGGVNIQDISNYGDYEGAINPYFDQDHTYQTASSNPGSSKFNMTANGIIRGNSGWDYAQCVLITPIDKRIYSKICGYAECVDRTSSSYSNYDFSLGAIKASRGYKYGGFDKVLTIASRDGNIAHTTPVYQFPSTYFCLDVSDLSEDFYYIRMTSCDLRVQFNSLWLEP